MGFGRVIWNRLSCLRSEMAAECIVCGIKYLCNEMFAELFYLSI